MFGFKKKEPLPEQTPEQIEQGKQIEKASYSKTSYRRVQKIREKGVEYEVKVPYLQYPLPEKRVTTVGLKTMVVLTTIMLTAAIIGLLVAGFGMLVPVFSKMGDFADTTGTAISATNNIPFLNLLTSATFGAVWVMIILIPLLFGIAAVACLLFLLNLLRIASASIPEKAVGFQLTNMRNGALVCTIIFVGAGIASFFFLPVFIGIIVLVASLYWLALFIFLQSERANAKIEFDKLPEEQQKDFIQHNKGLRDATNRRSTEKSTQRDLVGGMGRGSKLYTIMFFLNTYANAGIAYTNLKKSEFRPTSTVLGWRALGLIAYFAVAAAAAMGLLAWIFTGLDALMTVIGILALIILAVYAVIYLFPLALTLSIMQLKLNKRPIGYLALIATLAILVAAGVALLLIAQA